MKYKKISAGSLSSAAKLALSAGAIIAALNFSLHTGGIKAVQTKSTAESGSMSEAQPLAQTGEAQESVSEEKTESVSENSFSLPEDIEKMRQEYTAAFSGKTADGKISEVFFVTKGATDCVGKVAIRNTTGEQKPDFAALLEAGAKLSIEDKAQPCVLIFHTHTTESYQLADDGQFFSEYSTRSENSGRNMVRIGDEICSVLKENGIGYIHDTEIYDKSYNGAYSRSRASVLDYLKRYPSIKIVLDVHRDAIYYSDSERGKPTAIIDGKKAAQIMIISGAEGGAVTDFPSWEDNLRFALSLQKTAQDMHEGLMRPIYFCERRYNMDTASCSLLLEIGSDSNTLEEALYSARLLGEALSAVVNQYSGG